MNDGVIELSGRDFYNFQLFFSFYSNIYLAEDVL